MNSVRGWKADRSTSLKLIEDIAWRVRQQITKSADPLIRLTSVQLFEDLYGKTIKVQGHGSYPVERAIRTDLPGNVGGETRFLKEPDRFEVGITERTYAGLENEEGRARFTLCHEIGHLFLHAEMLMRMSAIPHQVAGLMRRDDHEHYWDTEWQADALAAALLAPAAGVKALFDRARSVDPDDIQETFGMSFTAANIRYENVLGGRCGLRLS